MVRWDPTPYIVGRARTLEDLVASYKIPIDAVVFVNYIPGAYGMQQGSYIYVLSDIYCAFKQALSFFHELGHLYAAVVGEQHRVLRKKHGRRLLESFCDMFARNVMLREYPIDRSLFPAPYPGIEGDLSQEALTAQLRHCGQCSKPCEKLSFPRKRSGKFSEDV